MKEKRIEKIKKMLADGKNPDAISNEIDSTLEEILKECATLLPLTNTHSRMVEEVKQLLEIYTKEENKLDWHKSDMYGRIIAHTALLNPGQILVEHCHRTKDFNQDVVINGVTMNVHDAIVFFDDLIRIHHTLTKRFFFNKMDEPDEEISEPLANAMREYIKKRSF